MIKMNVLMLICEFLVVFFTLIMFIGEKSATEDEHWYVWNGALICTIIVMMILNFSLICYSCSTFVEMLSCGTGTSTSALTKQKEESAKQAIREYRKAKDPTYSSGGFFSFGDDVDLKNFSDPGEAALFYGADPENIVRIAKDQTKAVLLEKKKQLDAERQQDYKARVEKAQNVQGTPADILRREQEKRAAELLRPKPTLTQRTVAGVRGNFAASRPAKTVSFDGDLPRRKADPNIDDDLLLRRADEERV